MDDFTDFIALVPFVVVNIIIRPETVLAEYSPGLLQRSKPDILTPFRSPPSSGLADDNKFRKEKASSTDSTGYILVHPFIKAVVIVLVARSKSITTAVFSSVLVEFTSEGVNRTSILKRTTSTAMFDKMYQICRFWIIHTSYKAISQGTTVFYAIIHIVNKHSKLGNNKIYSQLDMPLYWVIYRLMHIIHRKRVHSDIKL
jgi:hypothetical protein